MFLWLWLLLGLGLLSTFSALAFQRYPAVVNRFSIIILVLMLLVSCVLPWFVSEDFHTAMPIAYFSKVTLTLELLFDRLAWVMLCLISFISLLIHQYATRYLFSDSTQARFIGQLSALTTAVMFFVMSGNLFTTFVAWQLVGLCLYLLLNHYHYDVKANKAAKKKFIINRFGDICFLLAVLLTYAHYGTTSFLFLFAKHAELATAHFHFVSQMTILALLFVAVMTKSAQFPFHIWLPDTMETPTPVSALMHAGIINAGGFLLARLSPWFVQQPTLMTCIFLVGLLTTFVGGFFMLTQTDIKKQLAYSTIGQMGYMVMQCGIGCFAAAVFHLIAHGFFKGSLFLNAGNALQERGGKYVARSSRPVWLYGLVTLGLTAALIGGGVYLLDWLGYAEALNTILWFFLAITLVQFIGTIIYRAGSLAQIIGPCLAVAAVFWGYLACMANFNHLLAGIALENSIPIAAWQLALVVFCVLSMAFIGWRLRYKNALTTLHLKLYTISLTKGKVEYYARYFLLMPLRRLGEWGYLLLNFGRSKQLFWLFASLMLSFLLGCTVVGIFVWYEGMVLHHISLLWINLFLFIASLLIANRTRTLAELWFFVFVSALALTNLALFANEGATAIIGIFHFINVLVLFLALALLIIQQRKKALPRPIPANRLPWVNVYMTIFLMLFVGTPGTAGFIGEFYLLQGLLNDHSVLALTLAFSLILMALVILHTLQVYIFNPARFSRLDPAFSPALHLVFWLAIGFNLWNGLHPQGMLDFLSSIQGLPI